MTPSEPLKAAWQATYGLTDREVAVLALIFDGRDTRAIAHELGISTRTTEKHVENALRKLGVQSRVAAVATLRAVGGDGAT